MQSPYFKYLLPVLVLSLQRAAAQNVPVGTTAPAGTATFISLPPDAYTNGDPNYVRSYTPITAVTDASTLTASSPAATVRQSVAYQDGFNRTFYAQQLNVASVNNQPSHLVQLYDNRFQQDQYSFLPFATTTAGLISNPFSAQKDYYITKYPDEGYSSYSISRNTSTSSRFATATFAPGKSQVGQNRASVLSKRTNAANEVRIWDLDASGLPVATGYYAANELFGNESESPTDAQQAYTTKAPKSRIYTDKEGRVILKMVADSNYTYQNSSVTTWQSTYYVYDELGRLCYTLPPKAVALTGSNTGLTSAVLNDLCFQYRYDLKGRPCAIRKPGEDGFTWIVYDRKNRAIMRQTPQEAAAHQWEIGFFDIQDRIKATSLFTDNNAYSQSQWQQQVDTWSGSSTSNLLYHLTTEIGESTVPGENQITGNTMMNYTWYDNYSSSDPTGGFWSTYANTLQLSGDLLSTTGAETPVRSLRTQGMVTGTKTRILPSPHADPSKTGDWKQSAVFYDDKGHIIYSVSYDNYQGNMIHASYAGSQYDFAGRVLITKHIFTNTKSTDATNQHTEWNKNTYDAISGVLVKSLHKVDNGLWVPLSTYTYDDMGQVQREVLGNSGEVRDYRYNIRGQLTGINGDYAETGLKGGLSRTFGESLHYDFGFAQSRYDGKIAGIIWRGSGPDNMSSLMAMHAYGYDYDMAGRLKVADYRVQTSANNVVTPWSNSAQDYSVSNLYYDKNGNLTSMKQRGVKPGTGPVDMDVLSYHYQDNEQSNRLQYISDSGEPDFGAGDFNNGTTGNSTDYSYDPNGNLQSDLNKSISNATYTFFNKPSDVSFQSGKHVEFSYDAAGNKVQQITDPTGNALTTNYLGNVVYSGDKLQYALTSAGRTILDEQSTVPVKEEYFVKDHLGNVRSTIDVLTYDVKQYLATYELASANLEDLLFENIDNVRDDKPDITDPGDIQAARLNGGDPGHEVGTSLLLKVMAGDRVNMNVDNYYDGSYDSNQDNPLSAEDMLSNIISTLTGGVGGIPGEAHNVKLVDEVFTSYNYAALNDIVQNTATDPALPKAYLNYVLFDESMKIVPEFSGAYQANGNGGWVQIGSVTAKTIPANGYLAVYLSNNTHVDQCLHCGDVYFDKLKVEVSKGNLLEETHYYPHGLPISTLSSVSDNLKEQKRKYQSNEYITDLRLNWMDFQARQYDPQIGRFLSVDPLAAIGAQDMYSPYAAMGNAPESMIDPNGEQQTTFTSGGKELVDDNSGNDAHIGGAAKWLRNGGLAGSAASAGAGIGGGSWDPFHLVGSGFPALVQQAQIKQKVLQAWGSMLNPLGYTVDQLRSIKVTKTDDGFIVVGNLLPETVIKGKVSFGKRILSTIDNLAIAGDNWANKWFKGDDYGSRADKTYDADGGGIEFKGSDGQNQEGRKVGHPDDEAVNIDNMMFMFGNGGSGVSWTSFNERLEMISQGAEAITKFAEVTESLSDVMKPITEKPDTLIYDQRADGTVDFRSIPKDSLPYFRPAKFDVNGMYNSNNVLERK